MKLLFTFFLLCITTNLFAQYFCIDFDQHQDSFFAHNFFIDTTFHNNKWQIGKPHKTLFDSTDGNVIVTDTVNSYPPNDTSVFYFNFPRIVNIGGLNWWPLYINFQHYVNADTGDFAGMELSIDSGRSWEKLHNYNSNDSGVFSSTMGWETRSMNCEYLVSYSQVDTFLLRFTYISDSDTTSRDGWMIDNLCIEYITEGVAQVNNDKLFSIYPNPASDKLYIQTTNKNERNNAVSIWRIDGRLVYSDPQFTGTSIDISQLTNGIYIVKYSNDAEFSVKRFIIDR